ncbi:GGDEF domain-containing protein [Granulicella arctica]|uniref:GGDEF domain-containing protein n=1 Tax=Granulicella arctica TaxID=940613 RepID=UPI0021DF59DC|nr:sensor domain-containing diguanylate cyclase [Granulicella arctica]
MREKRQFEVIESRQMDHLRVFHDVARALTSALELEQILGTIMHKMAQFFGPERWSLLMVDEATQELYYAIAVGENAESLKGLRVPLGEGVAGWVASTGNPLVVPDVSLDPQWAAFAQSQPDLNIQSIACLPVRSENRTLGVIQLLNSKLDLLSEYSISFLRILCDYAAIAIRNARSMRLIQELSITDDCTGLFNARHLYQLLDDQVAAAAPGRKTQFSLLFLDLDHFKSVNDTHGHQRGTRLLAEVGNLLKRSLGPANFAFRYGGDEFVALMPNLDKHAAMTMAIGLCEQFRKARFLESDGLALSILASFGLATFPEDGETVHDILRSADMMMYEAKNSTRNNVAVAGHGLVMDKPALSQFAEIRGELRLTERRRVNL